MTHQSIVDQEEELVASCTALPEHDIGNGQRFLKRAGDQVRHITNVGWHAYDGVRWTEDQSGAVVRRHAHCAAEAIYREAELLAPSLAEQDILDAGRIAEDALAAHFDAKASSIDQALRHTANRKAWSDAVNRAGKVKAILKRRREQRLSHAKSSCCTPRLNSMLIEALSYRSIDVGELNRDRHAFNVNNGTLRFYSSEDEESEPDDPRVIWRVRLDPHEREDLITKLAPVDYLQDARPPRKWEEFLLRVQPSAAMRAYLQRLAGYALLGLNTEQMVAFFYGIGRNGKSTFVDCLSRLFGDYAVAAAIESFSGDDRRGGGEATPDLARLPGARLVAASEPEAGVRMKEALIKRLTGGEALAVRRLHRDFFEFDPQFTLIISGNHKPTIIGNDDGIWRRIHLVPWNEQIAGNEIDRQLPGKLDAEASGILKWAVEGALDFLNLGGLNPPAEILNATQEYREEEDPIGSFLTNACFITGDADDTEKPFDLFAAYERYAVETGSIKVKDATFYRRLPDAARRTFQKPDGTSCKIEKSRTNKGVVYRGINVREEWVSGLQREDEKASQEA